MNISSIKARQMVALGADMITIKDMSGLFLRWPFAHRKMEEGRGKYCR